jgi:hypothetical protein
VIVEALLATNADVYPLNEVRHLPPALRKRLTGAHCWGFLKFIKGLF